MKSEYVGLKFLGMVDKANGKRPAPPKCRKCRERKPHKVSEACREPRT